MPLRPADLRAALALAATAAGALAVRSQRDRARLRAALQREQLTALRDAQLLAGEREAREDTAAGAVRTRFVAEVGRLLETALDPGATLDGIAGLAVPELAELCIIDLVDEDGRLYGAGVASAADPAAAAAIRAVRNVTAVDPEGPSPIAAAARTRTPQLIPRLDRAQLRTISSSEEHFQTMIELGYSSSINVPLIARGRSLGVLTLVHLGDATYTPQDLAAAVEVAGRAALALDNARLFADLRSAEARQDAILEGMRQPVTAQTRDGRLVFANQAAADALGAPDPQAVLDMAPEEFAARFTVTDEHGRPVPLSAYPAQRIFAGERPEPLLVRSVERATGQERWSQVAATPVRDEQGEVVMTVTVSEDVTAVKRAEAAQRFLASASKLLGSSLDVETTLARAATTVVPALADWCRVDLLDDHGRLVQAAVAHPENAPAEHVALVRSAPRLEAEDPRSPRFVVRTGRPLLMADVPRELRASPLADPRLESLAADLGLRSLAFVPMMAGDRPVGLITLATAGSQRQLGEQELGLAVELGRRAGMAVDHARIHASSRHIAETLQRSLLPRDLPDIPGTTLATRFRAAGADTEVGGDFYDAFPVRGGWLIVMGDVTGKGPAAAAITAQARDTMRTAAAYEECPSAVLARLNATLAQEAHPRPLCSALAVLVKRSDAGMAVTISCAGHPAPFLVSAGGSAAEVGAPGSLLGAFDEGEWPQTEVTLKAGDALVLYTDGVTDVRGPGGRFGVERLAALLGNAAGLPADAVAGRIDDAVAAFEEGPQLDDLALLVLQVDAAPESAADRVARAAAAQR